MQLNEDNYIGHPEQECSGVLVCMYIYSIVTEEMDWDKEITDLRLKETNDGYVLKTSFLNKLLPENWIKYTYKASKKFARSLLLRFRRELRIFAEEYNANTYYVDDDKQCQSQGTKDE